MQFTHEYTQQNIKVTLSSLDGSERVVGLDFFNQDDPLKNVIEKKDVKYIEEVLSGVHRGLTTISRNQQFHIERDESHKTTL